VNWFAQAFPAIAAQSRARFHRRHPARCVVQALAQERGGSWSQDACPT
jgi:hypothetical protein